MGYSFDPPAAEQQQQTGYSFEPPTVGDGEQYANKPSHTPGKRILPPKSVSTRIVEALPSRKTVAKYARPLLEGGGAVGGAILGTPAGPLGNVAGAGLGYAMGGQVANLIEGTPNTLTGAATDVSSGAMMEMGGQLAGKAITGGVNLLREAKATGMPFSDKRNAWKAAQQFAKSQEPGTATAATANAGRQTDTDAVVNRLQPAVKPTPGQASGNYKSAALEQSMSAKDPAFAERLKYNDAELNKAAVNNLTGALGKPADLPAVQPREVTGANTVKAIDKAMKPVLSKEAEMWADVPDYHMPAENLTATGKELLTSSMVKSDKQLVKGIMDYATKQPKTVQGLQDIERTIGGAISESKNPNTKRLLGKLKDAVGADFTAMGEAAESGDVALHNGQIVFPSRLRADLARVEKQIADTAVKPDVGAMSAALRKAGDSSAMKMVGESPAAFEARVIKSYGKRVGEPLTMPDPQLAKLTETRAQLTDTLANLQPAEDVAAKYTAAKRYSKEEKFDRFFRGAVKDVRTGGDEATGLRIPNEQVPNKFFSPTGSQDLIKALGGGTTGRTAAAEQLMPHAVEQLVSKTVDANTGVMRIADAVTWMRQNASTLDNLGLTDSVQQVIKGQVPRAIEAELDLLRQSKPDILGNPEVTALQAAKLIKKYGPQVEKLYGIKAMQALKDYGQMMRIIGRNKYVSYSKGSTTTEKMDVGGKMAENLSSLLAVSSGHGWQFSAAKNLLKSALEPVLAGNKQKVSAILQEALINPQAAEVLMRIAKAKPATVSENAAKWLKPILVQMQVSSKLATEPTPQEDTTDATP